MQEIRFGLIGCGRIGQKHAWAFKKNKAKLVWVCDLQEYKAKQLANEYHFKKITTNYTDVLNDATIDAVSIATDHKSHSKICIDALNSGKHVLVEKPMATTSKEAKSMISAANKNSRILSPISQHQYDPLIVEIKELFNKKSLGRVIATNAIIQCNKSNDYYTDSYWRGKKHLEGGSTLINQAIHSLNITNWLVGEPKKVVSIQKNFKFKKIIDTEDSICCMIEYKNGAIGTLISTNASTIEIDPRIEIIGLKGSISFNLAFPNKLLYFNLENKKAEKQARTKLENAEKKRLPTPTNLTYYGIGHYFQVNDFINCIKQSKEPILTKESGLQSIKIIEKIYNNKLK